jgi:ferredoxin
LPETQAIEVKTMGGETDARSNPAATDDFEVYLAWSDMTLRVRSDQTLLSVLLEAGVAISPGCLTGGCGECATAYVEGDVIHKDSCLSAVDRERFLCPCVSRAKSRIVVAA